MLRFLVKYLLLAIILAAVIMLTAQWKLEKDINSFARAIQPFAEFDYESAKINLSGEVRINSIRLFIDAIDATVEIGELRFLAGNLYDLAFLESNLRHNQLPENAHLFLTDVLIPFNSQLLKAMRPTTPPTSVDMINAAYCGENDRLSIEQIEAMGYDYLAFSGKEFYMLDKYSGSVVVNGNFDIEDMFDIEYQFNISGVMAWLESLQVRQIGQFQQDVVQPQLSLLEIRVTDRGFNQNKAEYCAIKEEVATEDYYAGHLAAVEKLLTDANIQWKDSAKTAYAQMMKPDSQVLWFVQPNANFEWEGLKYYTFEELQDLSDLRVTVNGEPVSEFFEGWTAESFDEVAGIVLRKRAEENNTQLYREVVIDKSYQSVNPVRAEEFVSQQVRITRDDGRVFEGTLSRISDKSLWLYQRLPTGDITIPFARNRVTKFEVFQ